MIRFCCFLVLCFALIACGNGFSVPSFDTGIGGYGGESIASSSANVSSSSSGFPVDDCNGKEQLLVPINGEIGMPPYNENGVHACRRIFPDTYPHTFSIARISWKTNEYCTVAPRATYAVAVKNALTGFNFAPIVDVPSDGIISIDAKVNTAEALYVCAVLSTAPRSCVSSCFDVGDQDSLWGDTGADGSVVVPVLLEGLAMSPTSNEAAQYGNDKQRLMIAAW